jgi:hypothetical protein
MRVIASFISLGLLAGCATPFGALNAPPKWCMARAANQEPLKAGDDLVQKHADLKEHTAKEQSKVRCLQRYARAVAN